MIERICTSHKCNNNFMAKPADVKRGWALYCSKSCKAIHQEFKRKKDSMNISNNAVITSNKKKKPIQKPLFSRKELTENLYRKQMYEWDNNDYEKALKFPSLQEATIFMIKSV